MLLWNAHNESWYGMPDYLERFAPFQIKDKEIKRTEACAYWTKKKLDEYFGILKSRGEYSPTYGYTLDILTKNINGKDVLGIINAWLFSDPKVCKNIMKSMLDCGILYEKKESSLKTGSVIDENTEIGSGWYKVLEVKSPTPYIEDKAKYVIKL